MPLNDNWVFHQGFSEALTGVPVAGESVELPHNAVELPFSYFDETIYQREFTYQKHLRGRSGMERARSHAVL